MQYTEDMPSPACASVDPDLFTEANAGSPYRNQLAASVCARCLLRDECKAMADEQNRSPRIAKWRPHGIWGGHLYMGDGLPPRRVEPSELELLTPSQRRHDRVRDARAAG